MRFLVAMLCVWSCVAARAETVAPEAMPELAKRHQEHLRLNAYMTDGATRQLAAEAPAREEALRVLAGLGISKVYLETSRGSQTPEVAALEMLRDFFRQHGVDTAAGIATVPGGEFGVRANAGLDWLNFQNEKTQRDLEAVVRTSAKVFDEVIIDDFLCSGDLSAESESARGARTWSQYRRDLLTATSQRLIAAAREERPDVEMIIKYPQWYDLFHVFGYDVEREPQLYDRVWVGTETRNAKTVRFGFTQPYEGFVNYRWLAGISGAKIKGAWFDHIECTAEDFLDQAYQTVLAGAPELMLFSYEALREGHPGHQLLRDHFETLGQLAALVKEHPVEGVAAYKPMHSDGGGDLYIMDFLGMLGIPLVPQHTFPAEAQNMFLPTQAAADPKVAEHIVGALAAGKRVILTSGFLATVKEGEALSKLAGLAAVPTDRPVTAKEIEMDGGREAFEPGLDLEGVVQAGEARVLVAGVVDGKRVPFLTEHANGKGVVCVLNHHTYSQADFDAVGEVLLSPRRIGMIELPQKYVEAVRRAFGMVGMEGPGRVTYQPLGQVGFVVQNYRDEPAPVRVKLPRAGLRAVQAGQAPVALEGEWFERALAPRERVLVR